MKEWEYIAMENLTTYKSTLHALREFVNIDYGSDFEKSRMNVIKKMLCELRDDAAKRIGELEVEDAD